MKSNPKKSNVSIRLMILLLFCNKEKKLVGGHNNHNSVTESKNLCNLFDNLKEKTSALSLGATSIEKITKISAFGRNCLDPSPPLFEKGPTDENVGISYLIVIIKFVFFEIFTAPPPISSEGRTSPILSIEVAPYFGSILVCINLDIQ